MTKPYHLTKKQAVAITKDCDHSKILTVNGNLYQFTECQLKAYANAALDKVLGEPIAHVTFNSRTTEIAYIQYDPEPDLTALYAPKGST
jgi:hypothetical protein